MERLAFDPSSSRPWPPKAGAPPASVEVTAFPNGESHECGVRVGIIISTHCSAASASPVSRGSAPAVRAGGSGTTLAGRVGKGPREVPRAQVQCGSVHQTHSVFDLDEQAQ